MNLIILLLTHNTIFILLSSKKHSLVLGAFAALRKETISYLMSARPRGTTWLPLDGFSWNIVFEGFLKIC